MGRGKGENEEGSIDYLTVSTLLLFEHVVYLFVGAKFSFYNVAGRELTGESSSFS